jgi:hypothetical protein
MLSEAMNNRPVEVTDQAVVMKPLTRNRCAGLSRRYVGIFAQAFL